MRLTTPKFWYKHSMTAPALFLTPASFLYGIALNIRNYVTSPAPSPVPVICVGNLTAGGSGKTPAAEMVMRLLQQEKHFVHPAFLSRGYGRQTKHTFKMEQHHTALESGDEAQILFKTAPVYLAEDRRTGMEMALKDHVDCLVMDDGYQNRDLEQDVKILVINSYDGFGNQKMIPAGPLREPLEAGLQKADIIILIEDPRGVRLHPDSLKSSGKPVFTCAMRFSADNIDKKEKYTAFSGIAQPEKFFKSLENIGIIPETEISFPDHHRFTSDDVKHLLSCLKENGGQLITTEKDYVRLPEELKKDTHCLKLTLIPETPDGLTAQMVRLLNEKSKAST